MSNSPDTLIVLAVIAALLPLLGGALCLLVKPKFNWVAPIVATLFLLASLICSIVLFVKGWHTSQQYTMAWFQPGIVPVAFTIHVDNPVFIMLVMVTLVSFFVHVYSIGYMAHEPNITRYFASLGLFTFSMLGLIISGDLLLLFICWELVGLSSWLLIGFWRERPRAVAAATRAFLFNRVGDIAFLVGIMIVWANTGHTDFATITASTSSWSTIAALCIFGGAIGKSAQIPLTGWLPEAMEGPTPVSALIHAATMVAAGVFVVFRLYPFFTDAALTAIAVVGSATALYGGYLAYRQTDLKKILAWSTISQLGLMMISLGAHSPNGAFLHLVAHGFFKACLFVSAGAIIHKLQAHGNASSTDPQDVRLMGGLRKTMKGIFIPFTVAAASLAGLPFLSGFISKEQIVVPMIARALLNDPTAWWFSAAFYITSFVTVLYTYRMWSLVFMGDARGNHTSDVTPTPPIMQWPVVALASGSLWIIFSLNPFTSQPWMANMNDIGDNPITFLVTLTSAAWTFIALAVAWYLQKQAPVPGPAVTPPMVYDRVVVAPALAAANTLERTDRNFIDHTLHRLVYLQVIFAFSMAWIDRHVVDGLVALVARVMKSTGNLFRSLGTGRIQRYVLWALLMLIIFIFFILE